METTNLMINLSELTAGERYEMKELGIFSEVNSIGGSMMPEAKNRQHVIKHAIHAPLVINEAYNYQRPSSFSRALRLDLGDYKILLVSGTASVNEEGKPEHVGDFRAQLWRTYRNITSLLQADGMSWHDVVRTTNYLRDIERDYADFNKIRTHFYQWLKLDPLPASTGIQARLCWETLLVEIEVYAICKQRKNDEMR